MRNNEYIYRELLDVDGNIVGREYGGKLIRCKDCKFFEYDVCVRIAGMVYCGEKDFCSAAEPKETS